MVECGKCGGFGGEPGENFGDYGWHPCYHCGGTGYVSGNGNEAEETPRNHSLYREIPDNDYYGEDANGVVDLGYLGDTFSDPHKGKDASTIDEIPF